MRPKLLPLIDTVRTRRSFLAGASITVAGGALAGCGGGNSSTPTPAPAPTPSPTPAPTYTDTDLLNFALNLEYLEAEFYLRAATGTGLSAADSGNATSKTTGGLQVPLLSIAQGLYVHEFAQNELDHVRYLRTILGSAAMAAPAIDLSNSFNLFAQAAGLGSTFNPFDSFNDFLIGAFLFEDLGISAYRGAVRLLTAKSNLVAATRILAVEAYHAAYVRTQIVQTDSDRQNSNLSSAAIAVQKLRASLSGSGTSTETYLSSTTVTNADPRSSLAYERSTDQVLHIVYGTGNGAGVKGGAFFPDGLNGNISQTYS